MSAPKEGEHPEAPEVEDPCGPWVETLAEKTPIGSVRVLVAPYHAGGDLCVVLFVPVDAARDAIVDVKWLTPLSPEPNG